MNSSERSAFSYSDISQTRLSRRRLLLQGLTTIAVGPLISPGIVNQAIRQITPVPGKNVDFQKYFEGFHPITENDAIYNKLYQEVTYKPYPFTHISPDRDHPFGNLEISVDKDTSFDLVLPSSVTDNVSLHMLGIQVDEQEEKYIYPLIQSVRPSRQHMRLILTPGNHRVEISPLSESFDQSALGPPELSIPRDTPFQEALQNIAPVFNMRPDTMHHPTKDALLFGFTTVNINPEGLLLIEQHVVAAAEESNMPAQERLKRFGRTVDFETIEARKTHYDALTGKLDKAMLSETAIIQVRGHEWRQRQTDGFIDQIAETDNTGGVVILTKRGLAPSLYILPPGWQNIDLVNLNPEWQILGFRAEARKKGTPWSPRLPHATELAEEKLAELRENPEGIYPRLAA